MLDQFLKLNTVIANLGRVYQKKVKFFLNLIIILYLIITRVSNVAFDKAEIRYSRGFVKRKIS